MRRRINKIQPSVLRMFLRVTLLINIFMLLGLEEGFSAGFPPINTPGFQVVSVKLPVLVKKYIVTETTNTGTGNSIDEILPLAIADLVSNKNVVVCFDAPGLCVLSANLPAIIFSSAKNLLLTKRPVSLATYPAVDQGLEPNSPGSLTWGILIANSGQSSVKVVNLKFKNFTGIFGLNAGIRMTSARNITIQNCVFENNENGIRFDNSDNIVINTTNTFINNHVGIHYFNMSANNPAQPNVTLIENNVFQNGTSAFLRTGVRIRFLNVDKTIFNILTNQFNGVSIAVSVVNQSAVNVDPLVEPVIIGNIIDNHQIGLSLTRPLNNWRVEGNTFQNGDNAISLNSSTTATNTYGIDFIEPTNSLGYTADNVGNIMINGAGHSFLVNGDFGNGVHIIDQPQIYRINVIHEYAIIRENKITSFFTDAPINISGTPAGNGGIPKPQFNAINLSGSVLTIDYSLPSLNSDNLNFVVDFYKSNSNGDLVEYLGNTGLITALGSLIPVNLTVTGLTSTDRIAATTTSLGGGSPGPGTTIGTSEVAYACNVLTSSITGVASACENTTGITYSVTSTTGSTYNWIITGGSSDPAPASGQGTSSITVDWGTVGTGNVQVVETDVDGCIGDPVDLVITINSPPVTPGITGNSFVCENEIGTNFFVNPAAGSTYDWSITPSSAGAINPTPLATDNAITIDWGSPGSATVTVVQTDANGCTGSPVTFSVTIGTPPTPTITGTATLCGNTSGVNYSIGFTPGSNYIWSISPAGAGTFNPTPASTDISVTIDWANTVSSATVTVIETSISACVGPPVDFAVTIDPLPNVTITAPSTVICPGVTSADLTAAGAVSYVWTGPGLSSTTGTTVTATPPSLPETYSVIGTGTNGCTNSASFTFTETFVTVTLPSSPIVVCEGGSVDVCVDVTGTTHWNYTWVPTTDITAPTGSTTLSQQCFTFTPTTPGTFNYTVEVIGNDGCVVTADLMIIVNPLPVITILGNTTICEGESTTLTADPPGRFSYSWNTSPVENTPSVTVSPTTTTDFTVTVSEISTGCTSTATVTVTVLPAPTVSITGTTDICPGQSTTLSATGGYVSYSWNTSPVQNTQSITVNPSVNTDYTVTVTDGDGCENSETITVTMLPHPIITFTSPVICTSDPVTLSMAITGVGCFTIGDWVAGGSVVASGTSSITVTVTTTTTYTVSVTGCGATGCTTTASVTVSPDIPPTPSDAGPDQDFCGVLSTTMAGNTPILGIGTWTQQSGPGTSSFSDANDPLSTVTASVSGTYVYQWEILNGSCPSVDDMTIVFNANPVITISNITGISCSGAADGSVTIATTCNPGSCTITWSNGDTGPTASNLPLGNITVTVTDDITNCVVIQTIFVPLGGLIYAVESTNVSCSPGGDGTATVNIAQDGGTPAFTYVYSWSTTGGSIGAGSATSQITGLTVGTYTVVVTDNDGCVVQQSILVDNPDIIVEVDPLSISDCGATGADVIVEATAITTPTSTASINFVFTWYDDFDGASGTGTSLGTTTANPSNSPSLLDGDNNYSVDVVDGVYNCPGTVNFTVLDGPDPLLSITDVQDVNCNGGSDGTATATVTGGTPPIQYEWDGGSGVFSAAATVSNLASGTYDVTITDALGCKATDNLTIIEPSTALTVTVTGSPFLCDATITAVTTGGTTPYALYNWENLDNGVVISTTVNNITGLSPGDYQVTVIDANGCTAVSGVFTVQQSNITRTYNICYRWKGAVIPPPVVPSTPTISPPVPPSLVDDLTNDLSEQLAKCIMDLEDNMNAELDEFCLNAEALNDSFTINYSVDYFHYTLYYFDRGNNLVRTVPPKGVITTSTDRATDHPAHTFVSEYDYHSFDRLTRRESPDEGETKLIYDDLTHLRYSQNAKQAAVSPNPLFLYLKYDALGRVREVGESVMPAGKNFEDDPGTGLDANLATFPSSSNSQRTYTVYNDPNVDASYFGKTQRFLQNRISYTFTDDNAFTYFSYDPHGNVEWLIKDVPGIGRNYVAYDYDLISGNVLKVRYNEQRIDRFFHRYQYDEDNRPILVETSKDEVIWDRDASYDYFDHGPLRRATIGEDKIQGVDYVYTILGWPKAINSPSLSSTDDPGSDDGTTYEKDVFGMALGYYTDDFNRTGSPFQSASSTSNEILSGGKSLFDGNIASWSSQIDQSNLGTSGKYPLLTGNVYSYDRLNRIKISEFHDFTSGWSVAQTDFFSDYTYDPNGNLTAMTRKGYASSGQIDMDEFSYNYYASTNRLEFVDDNISSAYTTDLEDQLAGNYVYDEKGNLTKDVKEGIDEIKWTVHGKVAEIIPTDASGKDRIKFTYDAVGNRIKKRVTSNPYTVPIDPIDIVTTYYVLDATGNTMAVYERNNVLVSGTTYEAVFKMIEQPIYGSGRLGMRKEDAMEMASIPFVLGDQDNVEFDLNGTERKTESSKWMVPKKQPVGGGYFATRLDRMELQEDQGLPTLASTPATLSANLTNNIAVAENRAGELQFFASTYQTYFGNNNICMVRDVNNNLMAGSTGILSWADAKAVIAKRPGNNNQYYLITVGPITLGSFPPPGQKLYFTIIDMDLNACFGGVVSGSRNTPIDNGNTYGFHMAVLEDHTGENSSVLYATRYIDAGPGLGTTELLAFEISESGFGSPMVLDQIASKDKKGEGELQISPDGDKIMLYSHGLKAVPFDHREGNIYAWGLSTDHVQVDNVPLVIGTGCVLPKSSLEFSHIDDYIYFNQRLLTGGTTSKFIRRYNLVTNILETVFTNMFGDIRRGLDKKIYIADDQDDDLSFVDEDPGNLFVTGTQALANPMHPLVGALPMQPHRIYGTNVTEGVFVRTVGMKQYELKDHLGNVRAVVSDRKGAEEVASALVNFGDVVAYNNYYPFGMLMPDRTFNAPDYRFGFQGQEIDNETKGNGNSVNYKFRMHDPRLGRFFSVDPLTLMYPHNSPYAFSENRVIDAVELEGLEMFLIHGILNSNEPFKTDAQFQPLLSELKRLSGNSSTDKNFSWIKSADGKRRLNGAFSTVKEREIAAKMLVTHVLKNRVQGEHVTLTAFSGGVEVAVMAAKMLSELSDPVQVNLILVGIPAVKKLDSKEHPLNSGAHDVLAIHTKGDKIPKFLSFNGNYALKYAKLDPRWQQIQVENSQTFLPGLTKHFAKHIILSTLKEKAEPLDVKRSQGFQVPDKPFFRY